MKFSASTLGWNVMLATISVVTLGIGVPAADAISSALAPAPAVSEEPTAGETPAVEEPGVPDDKTPEEPTTEPTEKPTEEPLLTCEDQRAVNVRPPQSEAVTNSSWVALKDSKTHDDFALITDSAGKPGRATSEFKVNPRIYSSTFYEKFGCAEEGNAWVVVTLSDRYELDAVVGNQGVTYATTNLDNTSGFLLKTVDGKAFEPVEIFDVDAAGTHGLLFEVPAEFKGGELSGRLVYVSSEPKTFSDAAVPESVSYSYELPTLPFVLKSKGACGFNQGWC